MSPNSLRAGFSEPKSYVPGGAASPSSDNAGSGSVPQLQRYVRRATHPLSRPSCAQSPASDADCAADTGPITPSGILGEGLITLTQATRYCPRRRPGRKVHTSTVYRWAIQGCRGIHLDVIDTPGGLCTSVPALQRFFDRLTAARNLPRQQPQTCCSDEQHVAIEAELKRRFNI
jgi:hypothetical protein